jgi:ATP-binding cassette subfamily B protein
MSIFKKLFGDVAAAPSDQPRLTLKGSFEALKNLPKFLKLVWAASPSMTVANLALRLLRSVMPLSTLYVGKLLVDEVIRLAGAQAVDLAYIWQLVGIELALVLASSLLGRSIALLDALLGDLTSNQTSLMLIEHAAKLDLPQFEDATFYDKLERARRQTLSRVTLMSDVFTQVQEIASITFLAAGLIAFNPWLILLLLVAVLPVFLSETYFNQRSYSLVRNWTPERRELDYLRYIGASDETAKEIKMFGLANFLKERFATVADRYYQVNKTLAIKRSVWGFVFNGLGDVGYYVAYWVIIQQSISGEISVGGLTFLAGSFREMRSLLQRVLTLFSEIAQKSLYLQDLFDFLEVKPRIASPEQPAPLPEVWKEGFVFENVGFKYPNSEKWALRNLSFALKAGEKLALVGENGAGKTTLVKLLARMYDPDEGSILLDGKDIKSYDLEEYRMKIGVIFQDFIRFQFTVSDNIAIGRIDERQNKPKIEQAAQLSLADSVIGQLPKGYEQLLGKRFEGGVELSGGQWQKVALGRAYMRDAQLLILDEPTSALDARAEYEVFQRFAGLTEGKTAVLISHRFSTVRMADRILVIKGGTLAEIGSHEELLKKEGIYAELFNLQAEGYR